MRQRDDFDTLWLTADGYQQHYPKGHPPFERMTRLCEEAGERAREVNHGEETGRRKEAQTRSCRQESVSQRRTGCHRSALSMARSYEVEQALRHLIDQSYHTKIDEG